MRAAVIYAGLIGWAAETGALAEEEGAGEVMPWSARAGFSAAAFRDDSGELATQGTAQQSITVQANRHLWLSAGLRSLETDVPGLSRPFRELASVHVSAVLQAYPDALYLLAGGGFPLSPGQAGRGDSLVLSEWLNGYSPLPEPGFLAAPSGMGGLAFRSPLFGGEMLAAGEFYRPGKVEALAGEFFYPSPHLSYSLRYAWEGAAEHSGRVRLVHFLDEEDGSRVAAHREGLWAVGEYAVRRIGEEKSLDAESGLAWKGKDRNRTRRLQADPALREAGANDNLQRAWLGLRWRFLRRARLQAWMGLQGQALLRVSDFEAGGEARLDAGLQRMLFGDHLLEIRLHALGASLGEVTYFGGGLALFFSLRRLDAER